MCCRNEEVRQRLEYQLSSNSFISFALGNKSWNVLKWIINFTRFVIATVDGYQVCYEDI